MTRGQKIVVLVSIVLIALMHLIPPWERPIITGDPNNTMTMEETAFTSDLRSQPETRFVGYAPIWPGPPQNADPSLDAQVALSRLGVQFGIVLIFAFTAVFILRDRRDKVDRPGAHARSREEHDEGLEQRWDEGMTRSRH